MGDRTDAFPEHEVPKLATKPRRQPSRPLRRPARPVTEVLRELVYFLHATRVVARPARQCSKP